MALIIRDNGIIDFFPRDRSPVLTLKIDSYLDVKGAFKRSLKSAVNSYRTGKCNEFAALLFSLLLFSRANSVTGTSSPH